MEKEEVPTSDCENEKRLHRDDTLAAESERIMRNRPIDNVCVCVCVCPHVCVYVSSCIGVGVLQRGKK